MADRVIDELRRSAAETLPAEVLAYVEAGSGDGVTAGEAEQAWRRWRLLPRALTDVTTVDLTTHLLGAPVDLPVGVAPTTLQRAAHPEGEVATARAAAGAGALMVVSSNAGRTFEDIGRTGVTWWLQMYLTADRTLSVPVIERAVAAGARAVVLTADTPVVATKAEPASRVWDVVDPGWVRANFPPGAGDAEKARDLGPHDIAWLAGRSGLPVVVKGVLHPLDARRCVDAGAAAVWVSNHGGRQLDRAVSTADALAGVAAEVGAESEVYADGGVRSGLDVLTAGALGARAVFVGRPVLHGLAGGGERGVSAVLDALAGGLREALALAGSPSWEQVSGDLLAPSAAL